LAPANAYTIYTRGIGALGNGLGTRLKML
jgi:hypothetical protein